jgi:aspartyl protease family protein
VNGDDTARLVYAGLAAALVASSLFARRLPLRQTSKMILAWVCIFALAFVLFTFRGEAGAVWGRVKAELSPGGTIESNGMVSVHKSDDGHFWINAELNGRAVRLMVDSGATFTALSLETARSCGIDVSQNGFPVIINTANGSVEARRATVDRFRVGSIERSNVSVVVSESFGDINVVGMSFLSTLKSWRVEGNELLLNPGNSAAKGTNSLL